MKIGTIGNNKFLKELNETYLLELIRTNKQISKADLAQLTGLSPTACGIIVTNLLDKGYIREAGVGVSTGGRRPVLYELTPQSYFSIGVDIDVDYIRFILMDITGQVEYRDIIPSKSDYSVLATIELVEEKIRQIIQKNNIKEERLLGVGISIPGMIDNISHEVVFAPNLGWERVNLENMLAGIGSFPIYVDNEAICSAICENWIGCCINQKDFVCINMKSGIGSSIFAGGNLYRGCCGSAGEIGHIMVDANGPKCGCGNYGCLETLASSKAMIEKAQKQIKQGLIADITDIESITIDDIISSTNAGNEATRVILVEASGYLGLAVANIINTINPSKIVLGKELNKFPEDILEHLKNIAFAKALKYPASRVEIVTSELGEDTSALGAAIIPLQKLFGYQV
ncbi:ROK family transcriptional regulator [Ruminiclostridium herbifermentans]|uniref:ROK family transcriptional regulator n=1 Tax=Ruminiclostridium herbifermentans TaxID=2488810 RepID=A0A4V6ENB5_9FIRM|nr:ROK family transcriptional regulator [Ruminiclostridium herbifermentans]QNU66842.1 ROK family transcriptional regulator [Ruminiclostridium herbifermentans]